MSLIEKVGDNMEIAWRDNSFRALITASATFGHSE